MVDSEWVIVGAKKGNSLLGRVAALLPHVEHVVALPYFKSYRASLHSFNVSTITLGHCTTTVLSAEIMMI